MMQDYSSYAAELIDKIDAGELDPHEVDVTPFIEDDTKVLTPQLAQLLPDGKVEEYNARARQRDFLELQDEAAERESKYQDAIDAIRDPAIEETKPVRLGQEELQAKNYVTGEIERKLNRIMTAEQHRPGDEAVIGDFIDVMTWFIDSPHPYNEAEVWQEYAEAYGTQELAHRAATIAQPYFERREALGEVESFRGDE